MSQRTQRRAGRGKGVPKDRASLRAALEVARLSGHPPAVTEQARSVLLAWLEAEDAPVETLCRQLADGTAATQIGLSLMARSPQPDGLACAAGCAFCCIQPGEMGAGITRVEALRLHAALPPGETVGSTWHPEACPALDPDTRQCRAYEARPMICRAYVSTSRATCEAVADGGSGQGAGTLPPQIIYVTAHALAREALGTGARTYGLKKIATAALEGASADDALRAAGLPPKALDTARRKLAKGIPR